MRSVGPGHLAKSGPLFLLNSKCSGTIHCADLNTPLTFLRRREPSLSADSGQPSVVRANGSLKIPLLLPILHGGFGTFVIGAATTLGSAGGGDFFDNVLNTFGG